MKLKFSTRILAFVLMMTLVVPMFVFNAGAADTTISFTLGANGSASHYDGSEKSSYTETVDGHTLNITGGSKMYTGARDAKGNSCLKFGTKSVAGSCTINVPPEVTSVVIYVAAYKTNNASVKINNGTATTLTNKSDNGTYDAITVDTSETKTISFAISSGNRAMMNGIDFIIPATGEPSISIKGDNVLQVGNTITLEATLANIEGPVVWESDNEDVATVDQAGIVTGVAMGNATITAKIGDEIGRAHV